MKKLFSLIAIAVFWAGTAFAQQLPQQSMVFASTTPTTKAPEVTMMKGLLFGTQVPAKMFGSFYELLGEEFGGKRAVSILIYDTTVLKNVTRALGPSKSVLATGIVFDEAGKIAAINSIKADRVALENKIQDELNQLLVSVDEKSRMQIPVVEKRLAAEKLVTAQVIKDLEDIDLRNTTNCIFLRSWQPVSGSTTTTPKPKTTTTKPKTITPASKTITPAGISTNPNEQWGPEKKVFDPCDTIHKNMNIKVGVDSLLYGPFMLPKDTAQTKK